VRGESVSTSDNKAGKDVLRSVEQGKGLQVAKDSVPQGRRREGRVAKNLRSSIVLRASWKRAAGRGEKCMHCEISILLNGPRTRSLVE